MKRCADDDQGLSGQCPGAYATFTVSFHTEEDPPPELRAFLSGQEMPGARDGFDCGPSYPEASATRCYSFTYTLDRQDTTEQKTLTVQDRAGNVRPVGCEGAPGQSCIARRIVVFDFTPPDFVEGPEQRTYRPGIENPLVDLEAMKLGTTAAVLFVTNEPASAGAVRAECCAAQGRDRRGDEGCDDGFGFSLCDPSQTVGNCGPLLGLQLLHHYEHELSEDDVAGAVDVTCEVWVKGLVDEAGNVASDLKFPVDLRVDTDPPPPLSTERADRFKHLRIPWGAQQTQGTAGHYVVAEGFLASDDPREAPPLVLEGPAALVYTSRGGGSPAGKLLENESPHPLVGDDVSEVWLAAVDRSGNESEQRVRVRNGEWVATLGGKRPGVVDSNPHVLEAQPRSGAALFDPHQYEVLEWDYLGVSPDGLGAAPASVEHRRPWRLVSDGKLPAGRGRTGYAMAYHAARGITVLFGGYSDEGGEETPQGDTWGWDGHTWALLAGPDGGPSPRERSAMAYDPARGVVVLFGGALEAGGEHIKRGDTWEWDGSWRRVSGQELQAPSPRYGHLMAYSTGRGVTVLVGEVNDDDPDGGTWGWDGTSWSVLVEGGAGAQPWSGGVAEQSSLAYDTGRGVLVGEVAGAVWELADVCVGGDDDVRGACDSWALQVAEGDVPPAGGDHVMAYDSARGVTLLSVGGDEPLWTWDGQRWGQHPHGLAAFGPGGPRALVYDTGRQVTVVFGGETGTFEWDGQRLVQRTRAVADDPGLPSDDGEFRSVAMAYDAAAGRAALFDGASPPPGLWAWDGAWAYDAADSGPPQQAGVREPALAYDAARNITVLFGGQGVDDTWGWDGAWRVVAAQAEGPPPRRSHAMAYDPVREVVVVFGGRANDDTFLQDTWEWDGDEWTAKAAGDPCSPGAEVLEHEVGARVDSAMAYDPTGASCSCSGA